MATMQGSRMTVNSGHFGHDKAVVTFDGTTVTIRRGMSGKDVTRIPVSKINAVRFNKRLLGTHGRIEFATPAIDGRVYFSPWKVTQFEKMREAVQVAIRPRSESTAPPAVRVSQSAL
jgi:Bacterial PH domain